ncbi:MAG: hypothetical protein RLP44_04830 [Aggregatilineales bacterium]
MANHQSSSSVDDLDTLIRKQAQRLFVQRVYLVAHLALFIVVIILSRGRIIRFELLFAAWAVIMLAHFAFLALYEQREAVMRQGYKKRKREEQTQNDSAEDVFYDIGDDGELVRSSEHLSEDKAEAPRHFTGK